MVAFTRGDEHDLADLILDGAKRRPLQSFGEYFEGTRRSDALGAAYEGIYRLPAHASGIRPRGIYRFFACLDSSIRRCPADCRKLLLLDSLIIHLNDDHRWSRERIACWIGGEAAWPWPACGVGYRRPLARCARDEADHVVAIAGACRHGASSERRRAWPRSRRRST